MSTRSYEQYCAVARALDVVGERWTLLVVRDLLLGPRRFSDLQAGLPGIGPTVLSGRLKALVAAGVVRKRTLAPPAASVVYELTERGEELRPLIRELVRWGSKQLGAPRPGERFQLGWLLTLIEATFRPELARGVRETYEFRVDGDVFHVRIDDGAIAVRQGHAVDPAFALTTDMATFMAVGGGLLSTEAAEASGRLVFSGDRAAGERSIAMLGPHFGAAGERAGIRGAVRAFFTPVAAAGVAAVVELRVDDHVLQAVLGPDGVDVDDGARRAPDLVLETDLATLLAIGSRRLTATDAVVQGRARIAGDPALWQRVRDAV